MSQLSPKSLPSSFLIKFAKFVWTTLWQVMMARLAPRDRTGEYIRPNSQFRNFISQAPYEPAVARYRLYVGYGCPWAHRTMVVRALKGLEAVIDIAIAFPDQGMWMLENNSENYRSLSQLYELGQPGYQGRCTVPVLWDVQTKTIVNNESAEIIVMLNSEFNQFAQNPTLDLYPPDLKVSIDDWNAKIYQSVNNGVYRCGFAQTQAAYDRASHELFTMLDQIDTVLATQRYLCGDRLTLADVRLFTTLFRFDAVYYSLFKCDRRRIQDYKHLGGYLADLYQLDGVAGTCNLEQIKRDYYGNLFPLNPSGIIPTTPDISNLLKPHGRDQIGAASLAILHKLTV
jgi:glutathionyl-hydroquinone reductase